MIVGLKTSIIEHLKESKFVFHLTGSRHFGYHTDVSDYDFFVSHSAEIEDYLARLGFEPEASNDPHSVSYADANCIVVYRHKIKPVHIQLVRDATLKIKAQEKLKFFPMWHFDKSVRKHIWDWAMGRSLRLS